MRATCAYHRGVADRVLIYGVTGSGKTHPGRENRDGYRPAVALGRRPDLGTWLDDGAACGAAAPDRCDLRGEQWILDTDRHLSG